MSPLAVLILLAGLKAQGAEQILRRAEDIRNPSLHYAVDFSIHGIARGPKAAERDASYSMLASGKDRTVILMKSPSNLYGSVVMMADDHYWMLLPKALKPWELSPAQMLAGDIATGDLARSNLTRGYTAALGGDEEMDGERCWRLELTADAASAHYARIVYWVAKKGYLPKRLEHYGSNGKLVKVVAYEDYRKGALGLRSMRLQIESLDAWKEGSTLTFTNLRKIDPSPTSFTSEGMVAFRDAALAAGVTGGESEVTMERILRAMSR